ncbi:MAG: FRG domain-containing protein [Vicinamibacterales bacterium]
MTKIRTAVPDVQSLSNFVMVISGWKVARNGLPLLSRGQSRAWPILPKIHRQELNVANSGRVIEIWVEEAKSVGSLPADRWMVLAPAEHHGCPTPLLDWTTNPPVAVAFACMDDPNGDGVVAAFAPTVRAEPFKEERPRASRIPKKQPWQGFTTLLGRFGERSVLPVVDVPRDSDRQGAQSAAFSFSPSLTNPLEVMKWPREHEISDDSVTTESRVILQLSSEAKAALLNELPMRRTSRSVLFPDLDDMSQWVMDRHRNGHP